MKNYSNTDEYLDNFSGEVRSKLETMRKQLRSLCLKPMRKSAMASQTFKLNNKYFIYMGATRNTSVFMQSPDRDKAFL